MDDQTRRLAERGSTLPMPAGSERAALSDGAWPKQHLKVLSSGTVLYVHRHGDGVAVERDVRAWSDPWEGRWALDAGALVLSFGSHSLSLDPGAVHAPERDTTRPLSPPASVLVLPAVGEVPDELTGLGLVKVLSGGRVLVGRLQPDHLYVEHDALSGEGAGSWEGTWQVADGALALTVDSTWTQELSDGHGFLLGRETTPDGSIEVPVVLVRLPPGPLGPPADNAVLAFRAHGYEFFAVPGSPSGYFASVLEARRPSLGGGWLRFAAKCYHPSDAVQEDVRREMRIAHEVSATDGLVAAFENFTLPVDGALGEFSGRVVQILEWGDVDLSRHIDQTAGALSVIDTLRVARDVARAAAALHLKYGLVHSDLRPANIIGRRTGPVISWRLADFNVSSRIDDGLTAPYLGGARTCFAPEQAGSSRISPAADVWALGATLLRCALADSVDLGEALRPDVAATLVDRAPRPLRPLLSSCLERDPSARATAAQVEHHASVLLGG